MITTYQLADEVVSRTGVDSPTQRRTWIGDLVEMIALAADRGGDPPLASLCVQRDGTVGETYARIVALTNGVQVSDAEQRAAEDRLACYRALAADLPSGGGSTEHLLRRRSAPRSRAASPPRTSRSAAPTRTAERTKAAVCPTCFTALPTTGQCDYCG